MGERPGRPLEGRTWMEGVREQVAEEINVLKRGGSERRPEKTHIKSFII
jgi:hypothetical protein